MDLYDPNRFRNRKPLSSTERFLGVPPHAPPLENHSFSTADELIEDDVVFFNDDSITEPFSSSSPNHHHLNHNNHNVFTCSPTDSLGILAALPENDSSPTNRNDSHFFHKASVSVSVSLSSSSSSSSSRPIPAIPRPPSDRSPSSVKFHQSAPVNVPAMMRRRDFHGDDEEVEEEEEEMLPPHEMVARNSTLSSCSVLEGVGRTLKGRDLRQVRNAVLRQTGFLG